MFKKITKNILKGHFLYKLDLYKPWLEYNL